ncbi:hypothetical protein ROLI_007500 [Roseobacter fucihabitans]|uniref:Uncharacterized protein n=1 Tax=Roseobacter fucihabitans TaxID=1537242 RepID=A0ABZ2BS46_9RHOB|nr:hypothetical protein [Roseobacter litoralis]
MRGQAPGSSRIEGSTHRVFTWFFGEMTMLSDHASRKPLL